jgi:hypothetical protein
MRAASGTDDSCQCHYTLTSLDGVRPQAVALAPLRAGSVREQCLTTKSYASESSDPVRLQFSTLYLG